MKVKEISYQGNRLKDYEGGRFGITVEPDEELSKEQLDNLADRVINYVEKKLDKIEKMNDERIERKRKEEEEKEKQRKKALPTTKEEAIEVPVDDETKVKNLSIVQLTDLKEDFDETTPVGRAIRIVLGEINPLTLQNEPQKAVNNTQPPQNQQQNVQDDVERLKNIQVPSHVNLHEPGDRTLDNANETELRFIANELRRGSPELKNAAKVLLKKKFGKDA